MKKHKYKVGDIVRWMGDRKKYYKVTEECPLSYLPLEYGIQVILEEAGREELEAIKRGELFLQIPSPPFYVFESDISLVPLKQTFYE